MALFLLIGLLFLTQANAQLSNYLSSEQRSLFEQEARSVLTSSKCSRNTYYSLNILNLLSVSNYCDCNAILKTPHSCPLGTYFNIQSRELCGCDALTNVDISSLKDHLKDDNLEAVIGSILSLKKLNQITESEILESAEALNLKSLSPSSPNFRLIVDSLANLNLGSQSSNLNDFFTSNFEQLPNIVDADSLVDPTIISPSSSFFPKKSKISSSTLLASAEYLLSLVFSNKPLDRFLSLNSLKIISTYKSTPVYLSLEKSSFLSSDLSKSDLKLIAFNAFGKSLEVTEFEVVSLGEAGKAKTLLQNEKFQGNTLSLSDLNLGYGRYVISLSVTFPKKSEPIPFDLAFTIFTNLQLENVEFGVIETKDIASAHLSSISSPNSLSNSVASAIALDVLAVSYSVIADSKPQQTVVRISNSDKSVNVQFFSKKSEVDSSKYTTAIALAEEIESFNYKSGLYSVSILVAGNSLSESTEFILGNVELKFPPKPAVINPLYSKSLLHTSDNTLEALPEIEHQMRPPAKRASNFMAGLFTLAEILPLIVFIGFLLQLKPNFSRLTSIWSVLFIIALGSLLFIYFSYWLSIQGFSFYQTIKYIFTIIPVTIFIGRYALKSVIEARLSQTTKNEKSD